MAWGPLPQEPEVFLAVGDQDSPVIRTPELRDPIVVGGISHELLSSDTFLPSTAPSAYPRGLSYMVLSGSGEDWPHTTGVVETHVLAIGSGNRVVQRNWNKQASNNTNKMVYRRTRDNTDSAWHPWFLEQNLITVAEKTSTGTNLTATGGWEDIGLSKTISGLATVDFQATVRAHATLYVNRSGASSLRGRLRVQISVDGGSSYDTSQSVIQEGTDDDIYAKHHAVELADITGDVTARVQMYLDSGTLANFDINQGTLTLEVA